MQLLLFFLTISIQHARKHLWSHETKVKEFNCHLCPQGMADKRSMKLHYEKVHGMAFSFSEIMKKCCTIAGEYNDSYIAKIQPEFENTLKREGEGVSIKTRIAKRFS